MAKRRRMLTKYRRRKDGPWAKLYSSFRIFNDPCEPEPEPEPPPRPKTPPPGDDAIRKIADLARSALYSGEKIDPATLLAAIGTAGHGSGPRIMGACPTRT